MSVTPQARALHNAIVGTKNSPNKRGAPPGAYKANVPPGSETILAARRRTEYMQMAREIGIDWREVEKL